MNKENSNESRTEPGKKHPTELTKDVGFQVGARRTMPIHHKNAWRLLISNRGLNIWLGNVKNLTLTKGAKFELADGTVAEIRVFNPDSHLRLTWQPRNWQIASTIQVRVIAKGEKTVIAIHQENLPDANEREKRRAYYSEVLDELERLIRSDNEVRDNNS